MTEAGPTIKYEGIDPLVNKRIIRETQLNVTPERLMSEIFLTSENQDFVRKSRYDIESILGGRDSRFLVIVGPCSLHDPDSAIDYAKRLHEFSQESDVKDHLYVVMRAYFEKPRTVAKPGAWKGMINDPHLDGSNDINTGLRRARKLVGDILTIGLPVATEMLGPSIAKYFADVFSYYAVGARTVESQTHRELASGLSAPVGFKNSTTGNIQVAVDAVNSGRHSQSFLGVNNAGNLANIETSGNPYSHIILRGGNGSVSNYDETTVKEVQGLLRTEGLLEAVIIDASHANSGKDPQKQPEVVHEVVRQRRNGNNGLVGVMIESNINSGRQDLSSASLQYGVSVTDACLGFDDTASLLREVASKLKDGPTSVPF